MPFGQTEAAEFATLHCWRLGRPGPGELAQGRKSLPRRWRRTGCHDPLRRWNIRHRRIDRLTLSWINGRGIAGAAVALPAPTPGFLADSNGILLPFDDAPDVDRLKRLLHATPLVIASAELL